MPVSLDRVFGVHAQALQLRAQRGELLASNLANADTPDYKARDLDFKAVLNQAQDQHTVALSTSHVNHQGGQAGSGSAREMYRIPGQPSLDGNTVETQVEQAKFAENAVRYRASLQFINGKISGLMTAIRGD